MKIDFKTWQQSECDRLGISIDDHNKILEVSNNIAATGLGWPYDHITNIIEPPMADFTAAAEQIFLAEHLPPQKSKPYHKRKYIPKKFRRNHSAG